MSGNSPFYRVILCLENEDFVCNVVKMIVHRFWHSLSVLYLHNIAMSDQINYLLVSFNSAKNR